jgi:hypothetical protein
MAAPELLITRNGHAVPEAPLTPAAYMRRTTVLYGPSGAGKSVGITAIMKLLAPEIDNVVVISPTEPVNQTYRGIVPGTLIHTAMYAKDPRGPDKKRKNDEALGAERFLQTVWDRQEMAVAMHRLASDERILATLFARTPTRVLEVGRQHLGQIDARSREATSLVRRQYAGDPGVRDSKVNAIEAACRAAHVRTYQRLLGGERAELLRRPDLTQDEVYALQNLTTNPHMLLIFDDCASDLKPLWQTTVFRKLFYQNRHQYITILMSCQDDTDLPSNLRKNVFMSFFATQVACSANFTRASNSYAPLVRDQAADVARAVYETKYRMLAYQRDDPTQRVFYHVRFPIAGNFRFGNPALWELCERIVSDKATVNANNRFLQSFNTD